MEMNAKELAEFGQEVIELIRTHYPVWNDPAQTTEEMAARILQEKALRLVRYGAVGQPPLEKHVRVKELNVLGFPRTLIKGAAHDIPAYCGVCGQAQYTTPSGDVCSKGHGGAESVGPMEADTVRHQFAMDEFQKTNGR